MDMYGYVWLCMSTYGYVMGMYEYAWLCMAFYGYKWLCISMHGYVCIRAELSSFSLAHVDFSVTSFDDFGDWKVGNDCTGAENSGPCNDVSLVDQCMYITRSQSVLLSLILLAVLF